jgi:hypothetical protein
MRALLYAFLVATWALGLAGCLSGPTDEDWLAVGFQTPEQTFRTFQTGLRADNPDLEYRCLGSGLKRRFREENDGLPLTQLAYREFRRELFSRYPWLKWAAKARIREVTPLGPGRVRLRAEVDTWFRDEEFAIDLAREDFYEVYADGRRVADDASDWGDMATVEGGELVVRVPRPPDLGLDRVSEVRAGHEWKIDGFPLSTSDPSP